MLIMNYDKYQIILPNKKPHIDSIHIIKTNMLTIIAIILAILTLFFTTILITITCIGWFGLNTKLKTYINHLLTKSFDQQYRNIDRVPLNTECYICLERIKLPVITDCNHGCCGNVFLLCLAGCLLGYVD